MHDTEEVGGFGRGYWGGSQGSGGGGGGSVGKAVSAASHWACSGGGIRWLRRKPMPSTA